MILKNEKNPKGLGTAIWPFQEFVNLSDNFSNSNLGQRNDFNGMIHF